MRVRVFVALLLQWLACVQAQDISSLSGSLIGKDSCNCPSASSTSSPTATSAPSSAPTATNAPTTLSSASSDDDDDIVKINSFNAHIAVLGPTVLIFGIAHLSFFCLRDRFRQFYQRRVTKTSSPPEIEAPDDLSYSSAWWAVLNATDVDIVRFVGFDAFVYIQVQQILFEITATLAIVGVGALFPLFGRAGGGETAGYEQYSLANVKIGDTTTLYAPAIFLWFSTLGTLYLLERNMKSISALAKAFKLNAFGREYTVMVKDIPPEFRYETALRQYFQGVFKAEKVFAVNFVDKVPTLRELCERYRTHFHEERAAKIKGQGKENPVTERVLNLCGLNREQARVANAVSLGVFSPPTQHHTTRARAGLLRPHNGNEQKGMKGLSSSVDGDRKGVSAKEGKERVLSVDEGKMQQGRRSGEEEVDQSSAPWNTVVEKEPFRRAMRLVYKHKIITEMGLPQERSPVAFITFTDLVTASTAAQAKQVDAAGFATSTAPEARDIHWKNLETVTPQLQDSRKCTISVITVLLKVFWTIPVTFVAAISQLETIQKYLPQVKPLFEANTVVTSLIAGLLPVIAISVLNAILPSIYSKLGTYSGLYTKSDIALYTVKNLHFHLVLHSFIVLTISSSVFDSLSDILKNPFNVFGLLGRSIPKSASFFINYVTLNAFGNVALKLANFGGLITSVLKAKFATTEEERDQAYEPGPVLYEVDWAVDLLIWTICVSYAAIQPITMAVGLIYFAHNYAVAAYRIIYMQKVLYETSGKFLVTVYQRISGGLILSQITAIGALVALEGFLPALISAPLLLITWRYIVYHRQRYQESLERSIMPLVAASVVDSERTRAETIDFLSERHAKQVWKQPEYSTDFANPLARPVGEAEPSPAYGFSFFGEMKMTKEERRRARSTQTMRKLKEKYTQSVLFGLEKKDAKSDIERKGQPGKATVLVKNRGLVRVPSLSSPRNFTVPSPMDEKGEGRKWRVEDFTRKTGEGDHGRYHHPLLRQPGRRNLFDSRREDLSATLRISGHSEQYPEAEFEEEDMHNFTVTRPNLFKLVELANMANNKNKSEQIEKKYPPWQRGDHGYFFFSDVWNACEVKRVERKHRSADEVTVYIPSLHAESKLSVYDPRLSRRKPKRHGNSSLVPSSPQPMLEFGRLPNSLLNDASSHERGGRARGERKHRGRGTLRRRGDRKQLSPRGRERTEPIFRA